MTCALLSSSYPQDPTEFSKYSAHLGKEYVFIKGLPLRQTVLPYPGHTKKNFPIPYPTLECNEVFRLCKPDFRGNKGTTNPAGYLEISNFRNNDTFLQSVSLNCLWKCSFRSIQGILFTCTLTSHLNDRRNRFIFNTMKSSRIYLGIED